MSLLFKLFLGYFSRRSGIAKVEEKLTAYFCKTEANEKNPEDELEV